MLLTVLAATLAGACASSGAPPLRVLAAASLTEAFTEAAAAFGAEGGPPVEVSFAGSQTLLAQLQEGTQADVLATADEPTMDQAEQKGLVAAPVVFATNSLTIVTPADDPIVTTAADLAKPGVKLVLAGEDVPGGRYARTALAAEGFEAALDNLVSEEEDVKGVLGKVVSGEADAGVVYVTDVTPEVEDRVKAVALVADGIDIRYPIAVTEGAAPEAQDFVDFLVSGEGRRFLLDAGFGPP